MIYPKDFEERTGFSKIRQLTGVHCVSEMGREMIANASFSSDKDALVFSLTLVNELMSFPGLQSLLDVEELQDSRQALSRCKVPGSFLSCRELTDIRSVLNVTGYAQKKIRKANEENLKYPALLNEAEKFSFPEEVRETINRHIDAEAQLKDNASPRLFEIRSRVKQVEKEIAGRMDRLLKKAIHDGISDPESHLSLRNGRLVIPVIASHKRKLSGLIHDESGTGKTSYIEPVEVVERNNELNELHYEEKREEEKILREITAILQPHFPDILAACYFIGFVDFNRAKALFARRFDCTLPAIREGQGFHWIQARHPLLQQALEKEKKKIVPLDAQIQDDERLLLISGPNAGGKSVAMMTIALVQYMLQCGFLVPADKFSCTSLFEDIFIDMGDDQSLESDLSTYSSHLMNIKFFVKHAGRKTLVCIDEFGGGTEPAAGGAIAESVLEYLLQKGSYGVVTTHYANLKHMATQTPGIVNAAMLYDTGSMQPLFEMRQGMPGSSFAFEIAHRIGLPDEIVETAKEKAGQEHYEYDRNLRKVLRDKRYWENKREKVRILEKKLEKQEKQYAEEVSSLQKQRKVLLNQAKKEAEEIIIHANKAVENTIKEIRESQADKEKTKAARARMQEEKERIAREDEDKEFLRKRKPGEKHEGKKFHHKRFEKHADIADADTNKPKEFSVGDKVKIAGQDGVGEIVSIKRGQATLEIGTVRTRVKTEKLEHATNQSYLAFNKTIKPSAKIDTPQSKTDFKPQIDVRGKRADEALKEVQNLIDNGMMYHYTTLHILHGKGDGILRSRIRAYLKEEAVVKNFHDEHEEFGGAGITVVEL